MMSEFMEPGSLKKTMDKVPHDQQFDLIRGVYQNFMFLGGNPQLKKSCLYYGDSLVRATPVKKDDPGFLMERLKAFNALVMTATHYLYFNQDKKVESVLQN